MHRFFSSFLGSSQTKAWGYLVVGLTILTSTPAFAAGTWIEQESGTMQSLRGVARTGDTLIVVGNSGFMMRSVDGGTTWSLIDKSSNVWWHDVDVAADGNLAAVGEGGAYVVSSNNGTTWTSSSVNATSQLYAIDRASSSTGYIVGAGGTVRYFAGATGTWNTGSPNVTDDLYDVQDMGDGTGWMVGAGGRLLKASNGALTWTNYGRVADRNLRGVYFASSSVGWIVGEYGTLRKTTDGGTSWTNVSVAGLTDQHLYDIQVAGDTMVVAGDKIVLISADGGTTWTAKSFATENLTFYAATIDDDGESFWVVGSNYDVTSSVYRYEVEEEVVEEPVGEGDEADETVETEPEAEPANLVKLACVGETDVNDPCRAVYYYATDGKRHAFPNEKVFFTWLDDFDDVVEVSADFLSDLSLGANVTYHPGTRMVKFQSVRTVYAVAAHGELRPIASEAVAADLYGADWNQQIDDISDAFWGNYTFGEAIDEAADYNVEEEEASVASLDDNF